MSTAKDVERDTELPCSLSVPLSSNFHEFTNPEALWTLFFGALGGLHYKGRTDEIIGHWQLTQPSAPLLTLEVRAGGTESYKPLIMWLFFLATSLHPWVLSKSHLINVNSGMDERGLLWISRHFCCFFHLGNSKSLKSSVTKTRTKTKHVAGPWIISFFSPSFYYNVDEKKNLIPAMATVCVKFLCSPHVCGVFSVSSGFLPHPKDVHIKWIALSKLCPYMCTWECAMWQKGV